MEAAPGKGYLFPDYAFVGIAPSPNRPKERYNEPFGASSYRLMQEIVKGKRIYITNLIKHPMPISDKPKKDELRYYYPILKEELLTIGVQKRVLAFGVPTAQVLCPGFSSMREDHGTLFYNPDLGLYCLPTFHPSAIGRDPSLLKDLIRDVERLYTLPDPVAADHLVVTSISDIPFTTGARVFCDIETGGLDLDDPITAVGIAFEHDDLVYQLNNPTTEQLAELIETMKAKEVTLVGHNFQFDLVRLCWHSRRPYLRPVDDTLLLAHVQGEHVLSLKHLVTKYTDRPGSRAFGSWDSPDYLTEDVLGTKQLYQLEHSRFKEKQPFIRPILSRLVSTLSMMEIRGVYIDRSMLDELKRHYDESTATALAALANYGGIGGSEGGINWNSTQQVANILLSNGVPLSERTPGGAFSVGEPVLLQLATDFPIVADLLKYREEIKNAGFVKSYESLTTDKDPYLRPHLKLHGTETGRLSCSDPNLQQVPRIGPIKRIFRDRWGDGTYGLIDLSQAEMRVVAMLADDDKLAEALMSEDVHLAIASQIFRKSMDSVTAGERKKSKGVTFGLLYGGSPAGLAEKVGTTVDEVQAILLSFFNTFPKLSKWLEITKRNGIANGYVETIFGRRRDLKDIIAREGKNGAGRKAINTPVQSIASDIMLMILDYMAQQLVYIGLRTRPLFSVHDSTILEIFNGEEEVVAGILDDAFKNVLNSPLGGLPLAADLPIVGELKIARNWAEAESTNEAYAPIGSYDVSSL